MSDLDDIFSQIETHVSDDLEDMIFQVTASKYVIEIEDFLYGPFTEREAKKIWTERLKSTWLSGDENHIEHQVGGNAGYVYAYLHRLEDDIDSGLQALGA